MQHPRLPLYLTALIVFVHGLHFVGSHSLYEAKEFFPVFNWALFADVNPYKDRYRMEIFALDGQVYSTYLDESQLQAPELKDGGKRRNIIKKLFQQVEKTGALDTRSLEFLALGPFRSHCHVSFHLVREVFKVEAVHSLQDLEVVDRQRIENLIYQGDRCDN